MKLLEIQNSMLEIAVMFDQFCEEHNLEYSICGGSLIGAVRHHGFVPWDDDFDVVMPRADYERFIQYWQNDRRFALIKVGDSNYYKPATPAKIYLKGTRVAEINELANGMPEFCPYGIFLDIFPVDEYPDTFLGNVYNNYIGKVILAKSMSQFSLNNKGLIFRSMVKLLRLVPEKLIVSLRDRAINYVKKKAPNASKTFIGYGVETPFTNLKIDKSAMWPAKKEFEINNYIFKGPNCADKYLSCRYGNYMALPPENMRFQHIVKVKHIDE